ncbi:MAG: metallophosphoesterase [Clostridia bacterium]|nr:metallophosphoesterase [Clostridia bacterium]
MKIYALSDLHLSFNCDKPMDIFGGNWEGYTDKIKENWQSKVTDDDIVLIAGDISWAMKLDEVHKDIEWIDKLNGTKIMIKGNHEYWWKSISSVREILPESIKAIQNDALKIGSFIFCGSRGWIVPEKGKELSEEDAKIYRREVERMKLTLMSAKTLKQNDEKIILMIHFPPFNMDKEDNGFTTLFEEYGVDSVIFGHLHGYSKCDLYSEKNGVKYYLTSCDHINNNPVEIKV